MQDITIKIEEAVGERRYFVETRIASEVLDDYAGRLSVADISIKRMREQLAAKIREDSDCG